MKRIALILGAFVVVSLASAQVQPNVPKPVPKVIASSSGQFYVSTHGALSPQSLDLAAQSDLLTLEPTLLAVSCDRIKAELLRELNMPDEWRGKIFVALHPARSADESIPVVSEKFAGNWHCVVQLPDAIDRNRLVEAIVTATLLEIANRNTHGRPTEIPEWLARGMARQLMGSSEVKLILPPPALQKNGWNISRTTVDFSDTPQPSRVRTLKANPLTEAASILRTNEPLTFDQLSWPTEAQLSSNGTDLYGSSAQLFVSELLHLKGGPACLRQMLTELPDYLNWQLAFENAFQPLFKTSLDVEKWWALEVAQFSGRDLLHLLTREESASELDAIFQFPVHVQIGPAAPMRTDISLQTIIRGWTRTQQLPMLKTKIWDLGALRLRISPDYIPLLDQYIAVLQEYYKKRSSSTHILTAIGLMSDNSVEEAVAQLDTLDSQRAKMRAQISTPVVSSTEPVAP